MTAGAEAEGGAEAVLVATILRPHGVSGEVTVRLETDFPERFERVEELILRPPDGSRSCPVALTGIRPGPKGPLFRLGGVEGRDAAEKLRGWELCVPESETVVPPEGSYFLHDLVGAVVVDEEAGELGTVRSVWNLPAADLLIVDPPAGEEVLIPMTREVIREVDLPARKIRIRAPEGLLPGPE